MNNEEAIKEMDKRLDKIIKDNDPDMCNVCHVKPMFKTSGSGVPLCERCASPVTMPMQVESLPGRNEPCPCNSGKKFKQCCISITPKKYI